MKPTLFRFIKYRIDYFLHKSEYDDKPMCWFVYRLTGWIDYYGADWLEIQSKRNDKAP